MSTRQKILEVAEEMFLTEGYESVSVRDITQAADANVASVNYHFKSKKSLYREAFRRRLKSEIGKKISEVKKMILDSGEYSLEVAIHSLVSAFLQDLLNDDDSGKLLLIITQEMPEGSIAQDIVLEETVIPLQKFSWELIKKACPELDDRRISLYFSSIMGQILHFVKMRSLLSKSLGKEINEEYIKEVIEHITEFSVKGIKG